MKTIIVLLFLYFGPFSVAQQKTATTNGIISFDAAAPLYEEIKAENKNVSCLLNLKTGEISITALMKDLYFKIPSIQKDFNESYLESNNAQATFSGIIHGFSLSILEKTPKQFILSGSLKINGKSQKLSTIVILKKSNNGLEMVTDFKVKQKDFNIKLPELLSMKVSEIVTLKSLFVFKDLFL